MNVLVTGWFSFPQMGATAGDLLTRDLVCRWLEEIGRSFDIALAPPFVGGVDWQTVDPRSYSDVVFVCGPFGNGWPLPDLVERFAGKRLIGVNVSMLEPIDTWNPFALLLERDSSACVRPDLTMLTSAAHVPVVGIVLAHDQKEYRNGLHDAANSAIARLVDSRPMAAVRIDTRLDTNATGLRTAAEVESLIARMDIVVTTRLHGLVLALKNGVPAIAIDPVAGGAKVSRQANVLEWPICFTAEDLDAERLTAAFEYGLTAAAREKAKECAERARARLTGVRQHFLEAIRSPFRSA